MMIAMEHIVFNLDSINIRSFSQTRIKLFTPAVMPLFEALDSDNSI